MITNDKRLMLVTPRELVELLRSFAREVAAGEGDESIREKAASCVWWFIDGRAPTKQELERGE